MYKVMPIENFARFIADNLTMSNSFDFYDRWDVAKNPFGPVGTDAYNVKAELVNGVMHVIANAYGGGAPYCYCARNTLADLIIKECFVKDFTRYLSDATKSATVIVYTYAKAVVQGMEKKADICLSLIDFARLVWDHIDEKRMYAFSKYPDGNPVFAAKLVNVAESNMLICNDPNGSTLWWCEMADDTLGTMMNTFVAFLKRVGFHSVYIQN